MIKMKTAPYFFSIFFCLFFLTDHLWSQEVPGELSPSGILKWEQSGDGTWQVVANKQVESFKGLSPQNLLFWHPDEKGDDGFLRSEVFTIEKEFQVFKVAGSWGMDSEGNLDYNRIRLISYPGGKVLRETITSNYQNLSEERWSTHDLIGEKVQVEIFSPAIYNSLGDNIEWLAFENYRQEALALPANSLSEKIQAVQIDDHASMVYCRSIPFLAVNPALRANTTRIPKENREIIPVNAKADKLFLLGMINYGWENGVAHWSEHPEMRKERDDQNYIGNSIGVI